MGIIEALLLAAGLGMDACAVSIGAGATGRSSGTRAAFRLSFHFGLFQFLMPIIGWLAGYTIAGFITAVDHWIAFGLLAVIGGRMIRSGLGPEEDADTADPSRGWSLILLSIATSIDALAVGFSLAMVNITIWQPAVIIGLVTAAMSVAGLRLGDRLGARFGSRMEIAGGVILILIGVHILVDHTL